jgi:putative PIN family toxin of toxin-antitoxin system
VILDTSVLVSAALRPGSSPHRALLQALATCDLCASAETLAELERVLGRRKLDRYLERELRREFAALIRRHAQLFAVSAAELAAVKPACRDTQDNQFLALARVSQADLIVSGDEDLLVLHPWCGLAIVTPAGFLSHTLLR